MNLGWIESNWFIFEVIITSKNIQTWLWMAAHQMLVEMSHGIGSKSVS